MTPVSPALCEFLAEYDPDESFPGSRWAGFVADARRRAADYARGSNTSFLPATVLALIAEIEYLDEMIESDR